MPVRSAAQIFRQAQTTCASTLVSPLGWHMSSTGRQAASLHLQRLCVEDRQDRCACRRKRRARSFMINANKVGKASFTAKYGRTK